MTPELTLVIRLQGIDQRMAELQKEVAELPKRIAHIEKALDQHQRRLEADRAALAANQRDRKKCEGDIQVHEQKVSKLRDQMLAAKTNEQYKAFQAEIGFCEEQTKKCEDRILELMAEAEPLDKAVKSAEVRLKNEKIGVDKEKKAAEVRTTEDKRQLAEIKVERDSIAVQLKAPVLKEYERIKKKHSGIALADATEGRCDGCQMSLRPQFFQELKLSNGQIMHCESCGRILEYNPPVVVDQQAGPLPTAAGK